MPHQKRKENMIKVMSIRTNEIPKGSVVQLHNNWLVLTSGVKGETIPNFIPIESANVNGEVVSNERFMPTHVKEMLEGIFNQEAIPMIPSFDIKYAYIKDGDEVIRVEVYLTDEEKKQLQTFRDVGGLDFETNQ